ncbi:hypothetical protein D1113_02675 [Mycoplasmopsis gallopavonis]|nr:hypothetical protein D1113_02675 [Mycoplasmopsis gallopavonis]
MCIYSIYIVGLFFSSLWAAFISFESEDSVQKWNKKNPNDQITLRVSKEEEEENTFFYNIQRYKMYFLCYPSNQNLIKLHFLLEKLEEKNKNPNFQTNDKKTGN